MIMLREKKTTFQDHFKKLLNPKHRLNKLIPQRHKDLRSYTYVMTNTLIRRIVRSPDFIRASSLQVVGILTILCDHLFV